MGHLIVFSPTLEECAKLIYLLFRKQLGTDFLYLSDAPDLLKYRLGICLHHAPKVLRIRF